MNHTTELLLLSSKINRLHKELAAGQDRRHSKAGRVSRLRQRAAWIQGQIEDAGRYGQNPYTDPEYLNPST